MTQETSIKAGQITAGMVAEVRLEDDTHLCCVMSVNQDDDGKSCDFTIYAPDLDRYFDVSAANFTSQPVDIHDVYVRFLPSAHGTGYTATIRADVFWDGVTIDWEYFEGHYGHLKGAAVAVSGPDACEVMVNRVLNGRLGLTLLQPDVGAARQASFHLEVAKRCLDRALGWAGRSVRQSDLSAVDHQLEGVMAHVNAYLKAVAGTESVLTASIKYDQDKDALAKIG